MPSRERGRKPRSRWRDRETGGGAAAAGAGRKIDRKAHQLCSQVAEALGDFLAGDSGDDVLRELHVMAVEPAPSASRLLVTVGSYPGFEPAPPGRILERLARASVRIRWAVAAAVNRKRTPLLVFRVSMPLD